MDITTLAAQTAFVWPWWMVHVWWGLGIIAAFIIGLRIGRWLAYKSY